MISKLLQTLRLRLHTSGLHAVFSPRKPRHPLLRFALGMVGVVLLALLLVAGVFIGLAMLTGGLFLRLFQRQLSPGNASDSSTLDGEYRVVDKPALR